MHAAAPRPRRSSPDGELLDQQAADQLREAAHPQLAGVEGQPPAQGAVEVAAVHHQLRQRRAVGRVDGGGEVVVDEEDAAGPGRRGRRSRARRGRRWRAGGAPPRRTRRRRRRRGGRRRAPRGGGAASARGLLAAAASRHRSRARFRSSGLSSRQRRRFSRYRSRSRGGARRISPMALRIWARRSGDISWKRANRSCSSRCSRSGSRRKAW